MVLWFWNWWLCVGYIILSSNKPLVHLELFFSTQKHFKHVFSMKVNRYHRKLGQKQLVDLPISYYTYFLYLLILFYKCHQRFWGFFILENHCPKKKKLLYINKNGGVLFWNLLKPKNLIKFSIVHILSSSFWSFCHIEDGISFLGGSSISFIVSFVTGSFRWRTGSRSTILSSL